MTFDDLWTGRSWQPIPNCPGRFVLRDAPSEVHPRDLVGPDVELCEFRVDAARDTVVVGELEDGALISYRRPAGSYLHTLNTPEGFERKLQQLGITRTKRIC